jgi:hypothetical protein
LMTGRLPLRSTAATGRSICVGQKALLSPGVASKF